MNRKELIKNASRLAAKTWCNARFEDTIQSMVEDGLTRTEYRLVMKTFVKEFVDISNTEFNIMMKEPKMFKKGEANKKAREDINTRKAQKFTLLGIEENDGMMSVKVGVGTKVAEVSFAWEEREGSDITMDGQPVSSEDDLFLEIDAFARENAYNYLVKRGDITPEPGITTL